MVSKIQVLPTVRREVCEDAVKALEEALELARAGKVEDMTLVLHVSSDGKSECWFRATSMKDVSRTVGDLAHAQHELLAGW